MSADRSHPGKPPRNAASAKASPRRAPKKAEATLTSRLSQQASRIEGWTSCMILAKVNDIGEGECAIVILEGADKQPSRRGDEKHGRKDEKRRHAHHAAQSGVRARRNARDEDRISNWGFSGEACVRLLRNSPLVAARDDARLVIPSDGPGPEAICRAYVRWAAWVEGASSSVSQARTAPNRLRAAKTRKFGASPK